MELAFRRKAEGTRGRLVLLVSAFLVVLFMLAAVASAQVLTGTITGSVVDPSGAVIPNAKIFAVDLGTNKSYRAISDATGNFTITNVTNGMYNVTVEAPGFAKFVAQAVTVNTSQISKVVAKLSVAPAGTEVVVKAEQEVVQTETAQLKYAVDRNQLLNLQLPTRNPMDLVKTLPGMSTPTGNVTGGDVIVHGLRANSTNLTLDGINIADNYVKTSSFFGIASPVVDSVGEFNVSVGGVGADAGFGAAQVSMRTQRGTNALHGSVYWFRRDWHLNANTYINNLSHTPKPFQLLNRPGFSVGGPIFVPKVYNGKNKTFFFVSYERINQPAQQSQTRSILTDAARAGTFSYTGSSDAVVHTLNLLTDIPGARVGSTGLPIQINPAVMDHYNAVVPHYQDGQSGFDMRSCGGDTYNIGCFTFNSMGQSTTRRYAGRVDHNITDSHSIEFSYNQLRTSTWPDFLNSGSPQFPGPGGTGQASNRQVFSVGFHSSFGTTMTNEARFGVQRAPVMFTLSENYAGTNGVQINYPLVSNPDYVQGNMPQGRNTPVKQLADNFAWLHGRHTIRLGGEWKNVSASSIMHIYTQYPRIDIGTNSVNDTGIQAGDFTGGISSSDLGKARSLFAMLTGMYSSTRQGYTHTSPTSGFVTGAPRLTDPNQDNYAFYLQDSWKLKPNFTIEVGTRYEYQGIYTQRNGLALQPIDRTLGAWGAAGSPTNLFNVLTTPVANDVRLELVSGPNQHRLYNKDFNNFAPFLGFSWDPFKDGKTVLRGATAVHYTQDGFTVLNNAATYVAGMTTTATNSVPTGIFGTGDVPWPATPVDTGIYSLKTNFTANNGSGVMSVNPNLRTPYVLEWNLAVQREIGKRITFEARYVGNHAVKNFRMVDVNEVNLLFNPYSYGGNSVANALTEFKNAQNNLALCLADQTACKAAAGVTSGGTYTTFYNWGLPGQKALPILSALFSGLQLPVPGATSSPWQNGTLVTYLGPTVNAAGAFFDNLRRVATYRTNLNANFPLNFFVANPWANAAYYMGNGSWSNYNGLELEVRRRFSGGLFFQANYTFSKSLTDQRFGTNQSETQGYRSLLNPQLDKVLSPINQQHIISANFIYPLPFGRGQRFGGSMNVVLDKIVGGWQIQGMTRWAKGSPFTISANQWTGGYVYETANLRNMSMAELASNIGTYKTSDGAFWLNPDSGLMQKVGSQFRPVLCTTDQTTPCFGTPGPGEMGNTNFFQFQGPTFWNQDFSVTKRVSVPSISELFTIEFRFEMYNAFNHPTFANPGPVLTDTSNFGRLLNMTDSSRGGGVNSRNGAMQLRVNF